MDQAFKEALVIITGDKSGGYYIAGFFFSLLGIVISLWFSSRKRDKESPNTPYKFSWMFLLWDNFKRGLVTLIVMFILFRCFDLSAVLAMIGVGVLVALSLDQLVAFIISQSEKVSKILGMNRENFPQKPAE